MNDAQGSSPLARGLPAISRPGSIWTRIIPARAGFTNRTADYIRRVKDHPRSRGVYTATLRACQKTRGSSPLARGLPSSGSAGGRRNGIIPARAGFTDRGGGGESSHEDHPRSRGVYQVSFPGRTGQLGSSPLARGLLGGPRRRVARARIIPARAGFTSTTAPATGRPEDHPRSRGVYVRRRPWSSGAGGSSPLARGLPIPSALPGVEAGIIPARAGVTWPMRTTPPISRDHPRSRGVYAPVEAQGPRSGGSSPLARGLQERVGNFDSFEGIIPARAGFTFYSGAADGGFRDHPRSRGVYTTITRAMNHQRGSSPLARGLRDGDVGGGVGARIIPARAGFTPTSRCSRPRSRDHPRSRGVYVHGRQDHGLGQGSSPLARGLLRGRTGPLVYARIIPARAGFTSLHPAGSE